MLAIGRFSDRPRVSDLDDRTLDQGDLDAIQRCRPGDCALKLSAEEIESLTAAVAAAGVEWRDAVQQEFRRLIVERVQQYRTGGLAVLPPPADRKKPRKPDEALSAIVKQSPYLAKLPQVVAWLNDYPHADSGVESFFYWSKEYYGGGKPVISITHLGIVRPESDHRLPAILVAGKQIFATHYLEGGLGLTMVLRDATNGTPYLAYINYRMHPDNVGSLRAARLDICILANNHVLDCGTKGLVETLEQADIAAVGAGRHREEATRPVVHASRADST